MKTPTHSRGRLTRAALALALVGALLGGAVGPALAQQQAPNGTNTTANGTAPTTNQSTGGNATTTNTTNGTNNSGGSSGFFGGGGGFGVASTDKIAGDLVHATVGAAANAFTDAAGAVFMFPWKFVTMRFAPFEQGSASAGGGGPLAIWERPDAPVFGTLYDIAMDSMLYIALLLFGAFFLIDWFGNLSADPAADGPIERLFLRAADCLHLLFSWPIAWGHFLLASYLAYVFMPSQEAIASTVNEGLSNIIGLMGASVALMYVPFLLVIFLWLLVKHAGAFVYLVIGLAAYPALVAAGIPDHWLLGRLGAYAENTRSKYVVAAWWPVPTAVALGIGYQVDGALLELLTAGDLLNDAAGGAIVYPVLWLAALYAPIKVFSDGSPPMRNWKSKFSRGSGGPPSGRGGGGSPSGPPGGASALAGGAAAGALAAGSTSAGASAASADGSAASAGGSLAQSGSEAFSRLNNSSPSQRTLAADGGLQTMNAAQTGAGSAGTGGGAGGGGSSAIGGGFGPSSSSGTGSTGGVGADSGGAYSTGTAGSSAWRSETTLNQAHDITQPTDQAFDTTQRYEPYTYHEKGGFQRVDPPKRATWLTEKGGFERLDEATDEPLRFKGENDGQMYDLSNVNPSETSYNSVGSSGAETIRDT